MTRIRKNHEMRLWSILGVHGDPDRGTWGEGSGTKDQGFKIKDWRLGIRNRRLDNKN